MSGLAEMFNEIITKIDKYTITGNTAFELIYGPAS
jgi:hypothetical protein